MLSKFGTRLALLVCVLLLQIPATFAQSYSTIPLACSATQLGKAVVNEVHTNLDFVEVYLLQQADVRGWSLYVDNVKTVTLGGGGCRINGTTTRDDQGSGPNGTIFPAETFIVCPYNFNPSNNEVLFVDKSTALGSGNATVIDYFSYGTPTPRPYWSTPSNCGTLFPAHDAGDQAMSRPTDGSGTIGDAGDTPTTGVPNSSVSGFTKTASTTTPLPGQNVTFSLSFTVGADYANVPLVIKDPLPAGLTYVSHVASGGATYNSTTGDWTLGSLASGVSRTLSLVATVGATTSGAVTNTATLYKSGVNTLKTAKVKLTVPKLMAEYHFDDCAYNGTPGEVVDAQGAFAGTSMGSTGAKPTTLGAGIGAIGRYLNLGQLNQYVTTGAAIPLPGDYTVAFWMNVPASLAGLPSTASNPVHPSASLARFSDNSCYGDFLTYRQTNSYAWRVFQKSLGGANGTFLLGNLAAGWHHFAVAGRVADSQLFVNGVYQGLVPRIANGDNTGFGLGFIGGSCDDPVGQSLRMPIDEFVVFQGAMSAAEVATVKANQSAGKRALGSSRTPPACSALDHIRIEHDGAGNVCGETLTVKACANAACTSLYTLGVTGNLTWAGAPGGSTSFTIGASGQSTVLLAIPTAQTITLGTSTVSPTPSSTATECLNTTGIPNSGASCQLAYTATTACFDAVEVTENAGTRLNTKLAGTAFNVDVVTSAGTPYTGDLKVSLVDTTASSGNCSDIASGLTSEVTLTYAAESRKTVSFSSAQAASNAKVRIRESTSSQPACSTDAFAIRPLKFVLSANSGMTPATDKWKAGGSNFGLTANPGVTSGYLSNVPVIQSAKVTDHTGATNAPLSGSFAPGSGGSVTGIGFKYGEVGTFTLTTDAMVDSSFTSVDQPGDCDAGATSNTLSGGKVGCNIGSDPLGPLGRFTPDRYKVVVTPACGALTYSGQPFNKVVVTAQNSSSGTTQRFDYSIPANQAYAKDVTLAAAGGTFQNGVIGKAKFTLGEATLITAVPAFSFDTRPSPAGTISISGTDADGITGTTSSNPTITDGRLRLVNAFGPENLPLAMPAYIEYWEGAESRWKLSTIDSCTSFTASDLALVFPVATSNKLAACETAVTSITGSAPSFNINLAAPGTGNAGWTDVTLNLGAAASGNRCPSVGGTAVAATTANRPWLQFDWKGTGLVNPSVRAGFGLYNMTGKAQKIIDRREVR